MDRSNVALNKPATQTSSYETATASKAVDGNTDGIYNNGSITHTILTPNNWWQVDLLESFSISDITLFNRTDCCTERLSNFYVFVSDSDMTGRSFDSLKNDSTVWQYYQAAAVGASESIAVPGKIGRYVRVVLAGTEYLSLAEVEVAVNP